MTELHGVITAMVTPFEEDGAVDLPACRRLARHLLEHGSHGLVLTGTTGESPTLSDDEKLAILREVRAELGEEATLIAGTGSNDTRHSIELTKRAEAEGADAALVVTPYYNRPNPAGVTAHFEAVAAATKLPIVIYNIPSRCVVNIPPAQLADLAREIPNVVAVKQANDDELGPIEGMDLLAGNDNVFQRCLESEGSGGILVASHLVGERMREQYEAVLSGDQEAARRIDAELQLLYADLAVTSNPIPVKTALEILGICSATMRLPMVPASDSERATLKAALERHSISARVV